MEQNSEESEQNYEFEELLQKAIIAIGPNYLHDHDHVDKFLRESHLGIEISHKEMDYLFDMWQKGELQPYLLNYIPKGLHEKFKQNEEYRNTVNEHSIVNLDIARAKPTHADIGFAYTKATDEQRQRGAILQKIDVRQKMFEQKGVQFEFPWPDSSMSIGKYAEKCLANCLKEKDLLYANVGPVSGQMDLP